MAWFMGAAMLSHFHNVSISRGVGGTAHKELTFQGVLVLPPDGEAGGFAPVRTLRSGHLDLGQGVCPSLHVICMAQSGGSASSSGFLVAPQIHRTVPTLPQFPRWPGLTSPGTASAVR